MYNLAPMSQLAYGKAGVANHKFQFCIADPGFDPQSSDFDFFRPPVTVAYKPARKSRPPKATPEYSPKLYALLSVVGADLKKNDTKIEPPHSVASTPTIRKIFIDVLLVDNCPE